MSSLVVWHFLRLSGVAYGHDDVLSDGDDIGSGNFSNEDLLLVGGVEVCFVAVSKALAFRC